MSTKVNTILGPKLGFQSAPWTKQWVIGYASFAAVALVFQYVLVAVEGSLSFVNPGFDSPFGVGDSPSDMVLSFIMKFVTSLHFAYFWYDFYIRRRDPVGSDGEPLTVYDPEYMPVEIAPWLSFTVIFTVANCLAFQQSNTMMRKLASMFFPPYVYNDEGIFDKTLITVFAVYAMIPLTFMVVIHVANAGKMRYFLAGTTGMVVRPFYLLAMYWLCYNYGEMQTRREQSLLERADNQTAVWNGMWICYYILPLVLGLLNAYVFKVDWGLLPSSASFCDYLKQLVLFFVIPSAMAVAVAAYLVWGVTERFDAVVFGVPCVAPEGTPECLLDSECQLGLGECSPAWLQQDTDLFWYLVQSAQYWWPLVFWLLSLPSAFKCINHSFFLIYGMNAFSQVRFILTECTGIPFAMRTVNLNYEAKNWLISIPTTTANTDVLAFFLFLGLCLRCKMPQQPDKMMTVPIGVYKTRLTFSIPAYIFFAAAKAVTQMSEPPYAFSISQSFAYVFGVAVPAYNLWDYGWLRTMSCLIAREYDDEMASSTQSENSMASSTQSENSATDTDFP